MRLGIFGGTFNPIHFGHLRAAEEVRYGCNLDKIIFMPSGCPPLKSAELPEAIHRDAMTRLATGSNVNFLVSDLEMRQKVKSYTVTTVETLRKLYAGDELFFIMGLDAFLDLPHWREPERLVSSIDFIIVTRPGFEMQELMISPYIEDTGVKPQAAMTAAGRISLHLKGGRNAQVVSISAFEVSSTSIRRLVREGKSIKYLVPEAVEQYIHSHHLYSD